MHRDMYLFSLKVHSAALKIGPTLSVMWREILRSEFFN